jgi:hypothetical protein
MLSAWPEGDAHGRADSGPLLNRLDAAHGHVGFHSRFRRHTAGALRQIAGLAGNRGVSGAGPPRQLPCTATRPDGSGPKCMYLGSGVA